ncbi:MAG: penicillin-binding protein activator [Deltaproteobacteria bacterium]|nr:penicillin-binding protein activator [Deltaproteobacteria bacterium]
MKIRVTAAAVSFLILRSIIFAAPSWSETYRERLFSVLNDIEKAGPTDKNTSALEDFILSHPSSPVTDEAISRIASIYTEKKDFKKASDYYQKLLENFPASPYKAESLYGLGYCRYRMGDMGGARKTLKEVLSNPDSTLTLTVKAQALLSALEEIETGEIETVEKGVRRTHIGAILPLKGEYSSFGENALRGILLAANIFPEGGGEGGGRPQEGVEVVTEDSGEDEESARKAMEKLSNAGVVGVVGPLLSATAQSAANLARQKSIPSIVLSQKEGIAGRGDYVFRNFLTPKAQAKAIASYAIRTLGLRRFAVLYPENSYGTELALRFKEAVKKNGAAIAGEVSYAAEKKDFSSELKTLFAVKMKEELRGRRRITEYTPTAGIDALFIPDYYTTVAQIAPYLAYYNVKGVQLLGGNGWDSKELLRLAGDSIEGAVFADGFFPGSKRKGTEEFVGRFRKTFGYTPGILEAEGYDSATIMLSSINNIYANPGGERLSDVREALKGSIANTAIEGATGSIRFDSGGEAVKELFILKVKKGNIVEVETPAP